MGHAISALIAAAPIDLDAARELDLPVFIQRGFAIVALHPGHCDWWTEKLGLENKDFSNILLDCPAMHEFAKRLGMERYALIDTDYFGGAGAQYAAVYCGPTKEMEETEGGINEALKRLGVFRAPGLDEFDTIGLGRHRSFDELFKKYWPK